MTRLERKKKLLMVCIKQGERKYEQCLFRLANIKYDDSAVEFCAGFHSYELLIALCEEILEEDAISLRQWMVQSRRLTFMLKDNVGANINFPCLSSFF